MSAYGPKLDLREATGKMGLHLGVDEANQCFQTSIKKMINGKKFALRMDLPSP